MLLLLSFAVGFEMSGKNIYRVLSPENRAPSIGSDLGAIE